MSKSAAITQARKRVPPRVAKVGDSALVKIFGLVDERFPGFGDLSGVRTAVIDLAGITFVTSFGVRQWLISMSEIPAEVSNLYLLNCPSIIVDQLNMIFNFGGRARVVSLSAPFMCTKCGAESKHTIDVLSEGAMIADGKIGQRSCAKCAGPLELDEMIDSYFACLKKYGATSVDPAAARLIAQSGQLETKEVKARPGTAPAAVAVEVPSGGRKGLGIAVVVVIVGALAAGVYVLVAPS